MKCLHLSLITQYLMMTVGFGGWSAVQLTSGTNAITATGGDRGTHPSTSIPHLEGDIDDKVKGKVKSGYGGGCMMGSFYTAEGTDRDHAKLIKYQQISLF